MFLVDHYNFGLRREFTTLEEARLFCIRVCFDAIVYHNGDRVAKFTSTGGWSLR